MDKILLIDYHNALHRAKVSFGKKVEGEESFNIVYNFFRSLRATIEQFSPTKVFICNEGKDNFRYDLFSEYKENRIVKTSSKKNIEKQEDFHRQKRIITRLLSHLPLQFVKADGFEADDVIGTLADDLKNESVVIFSNDSDFIQLLQKGYADIKIYNPIKKEYFISPDYHYLTFKCLNGDVTDNIPRVVGKLAAIELAKNPKAFLKFIEAEENRANYSLNKNLIELKIIPDELLQFSDYEVNFDKLKEEFEHMDFKTMTVDKYWNNFVQTFKELV